MGQSRYIIDNPEPPTALETFGKGINQVGNVYLAEMLRKKQRDEKLQDAIKLLEMKQKFAPKTNPISTSIRISPLSFGEKQQHAGILGETPESAKKVNEEKGYAPTTQEIDTGKLGPLGNIQNAVRNSQFPGASFIPEPQSRKQTVFTPEFNALRQESAAKLKNPFTVSKTITHKGNVFSGQALDSGDMEFDLPDASEYQEGTVLQDNDGTQFKVVNGEWARL